MRAMVLLLLALPAVAIAQAGERYVARGAEVDRGPSHRPEPRTPWAAERAFAADAQALGQWTAFRTWAAADATMFVPQPTNAQAWLKDRRDPPHAIRWWPTASYISCDGRLAVNTGGWRLADGSVGYFTTVWRRAADGGWRWIVDGGDSLTRARREPVRPRVERAACRNVPVAMRNVAGPPALAEGGASPDGSLTWDWVVQPSGARTFVAEMWDGRARRRVIDDAIAAPAS